MSLYNFNFVKGEGLQVKIDKDELAEMMKQDRQEEKRQEDLDYLEECNNDKYREDNE